MIIEGHELDKQDLVDEVEEALERVLDERMEEVDDFATYEKTLMKITRDLARSKLEKKLQPTSDQLVKRLWIVTTWHGRWTKPGQSSNTERMRAAR